MFGRQRTIHPPKNQQKRKALSPLQLGIRHAKHQSVSERCEQTILPDTDGGRLKSSHQTNLIVSRHPAFPS